MRWRPLLVGLLAGCGAVGLLAARADGPAPVTPQPLRPADPRIWNRLDDAARKPAVAGGRRAIAVAEVGYPRTAKEAAALGGQALLLVIALAQKIDDALVERATLHFEDGQEADLVRLTAQLNDVDDEKHPAAQLVGRYRHDSLFFMPLTTTGTKAYVSATYAGRSEVVARFPRAPSAYPSTLPVLKPDMPTRLEDVGAIARALYPFFRTAPLRSPGAEATCTLHGPTNPTEPPEPLTSAELLKKGGLKPSLEKGPGKARAQGSLNKEIIAEVIRAHTLEVLACYARERWTDPKLSGRVMVQFTIDADGWVTVSVLQNTTVERKSLTDCIVAVVRCWRFPKPVGGGIVVVSYPFVLTPPSSED